MRKVCSYCGRELPGSEPEATVTSHGICQRCFDKLNEQIDAEIAKRAASKEASC